MLRLCYIGLAVIILDSLAILYFLYQFAEAADFSAYPSSEVSNLPLLGALWETGLAAYLCVSHRLWKTALDTRYPTFVRLAVSATRVDSIEKL